MSKYVLHIVVNDSEHTKENAIQLMEFLNKGYQVMTQFNFEEEIYYILNSDTYEKELN